MRYAYSSLQSIRNFGIPFATMSDTQVLSLIPVYSERINSITEKVFSAVTKKIIITVDGGSKLLKIPGSPVLAVSSLVYTDPSNVKTTLDPSWYGLFENQYIKLFTNSTWDLTLSILKGTYNDSFTTDYRLYGTMYADSQNQVDNLEVNATIGWIEELGDSITPVTVELASPIQSGTESFTVQDASKLVPRNILTFGNVNLYINSINYTTNTISIDKIESIATIPTGTKTTCYGSPPLLIEHALNLFILHHKKLINSSGGSSRRERLGEYLHESSGNPMGVTGINEIDSILYKFMSDGLDMTFL